MNKILWKLIKHIGGNILIKWRNSEIFLEIVYILKSKIQDIIDKLKYLNFMIKNYTEIIDWPAFLRIKSSQRFFNIWREKLQEKL